MKLELNFSRHYNNNDCCKWVEHFDKKNEVNNYNYVEHKLKFHNEPSNHEQNHLTTNNSIDRVTLTAINFKLSCRFQALSNLNKRSQT